jgi:hypothetical protein
MLRAEQAVYFQFALAFDRLKVLALGRPRSASGCKTSQDGTALPREGPSSNAEIDRVLARITEKKSKGFYKNRKPATSGNIRKVSRIMNQSSRNPMFG